MAGDWMPLRLDIADDPAVIAISDECEIDDCRTIGALVKLWTWANRHLENGYASSVTEKWIDRYIGVAGFANAMTKAGWLLVTDAGIEFPNFDRWNSKSAKNRILSAKRMKSHREKCDDASVTKSQPEKRRVEKRKEEKKSPLTPLSVDVPNELATTDFMTVWTSWIADRKDRKKPMTARAAEEQLKSLLPLGPQRAADCVRESIRNGWQGLFPEKFSGSITTAKPPPKSFDQQRVERANALLDSLTEKPKPALPPGTPDAA